MGNCRYKKCNIYETFVVGVLTVFIYLPYENGSNDLISFLLSSDRPYLSSKGILILLS